ncbi:MAG TPA: hypothetical protein VIM73_23205, partial [Polyangiaceae bacterium]
MAPLILRRPVGASGEATDGAAPLDASLRTSRIATSLDQVLAAWRFVYDCHAHDGERRESRFRLHTTAQAAGPGTLVLLGESAGRLIATLTIVRDGQRGLALDARFPRALAALRATGKRLSELGLMAHS